MNKVPLTEKGAQQLREELQELKTVVRPKVVTAIAEARAHGDLKENAEYHAAREEQGFVEGRIRDLEHQLAHAQIIDVSKLQKDGRVVFGVTVDLVNIETDEEASYQIVGDLEANIKENKISINSPIARALIGKREGDEIQVQAPSGIILYEIAAIGYQ
ncbi:transcription elongation factor GreA [Nitrosococcus oceani]|uniref:Transcription elongation factor GreA n=2 Tax=Nitrosococcus oceani TaxID=1229 RepID=GREA_NITOC|nr:transcription elongation factor GreA [Nitrosococcus oceani]Q3J822.1 RecName: Full=Transcription elongation factor GreA; AltName: Full=Transcript cleavage factor GreA [Nitrosococcus oceani ATCC 19707]KFI18547.1 transcription elongation factor GreA [Nitrosococcus oceani C-27]ABA59024.1 transcription elongation factor GreA [Nitrosococcus oceani ATCC 19707]EDZ65324.1 transcription elongation factor GreA subfamily [Nitrosococcus oceani AFC27]KFI21775.1 transcription elongation factor GreA [Nitro